MNSGTDISQILSGNIREIARAISLVENYPERAPELLIKLLPHTGHARTLGVTGSPGAGKSTLIDNLAIEAKNRGEKVAIVAVDPSSPYSGGAILGDRIRMSRIGNEPQIYLRSLATRGALGGLSRACYDTMAILDAAGFGLIILETVGVGQSEIDVVQIADTVAVVVVPGMGDGVQAFKAGILEIADLYVINKADRSGVDSLERDLLSLIATDDAKQEDWNVKILRTIATEGKGVSELLDAINEHSKWLKQSPVAMKRRSDELEVLILRLLSERVTTKVKALFPAELSDLSTRLNNRSVTQYQALDEIWKSLFKNTDINRD